MKNLNIKQLFNKNLFSLMFFLFLLTASSAIFAASVKSEISHVRNMVITGTVTAMSKNNITIDTTIYSIKGNSQKDITTANVVKTKKFVVINIANVFVPDNEKISKIDMQKNIKKINLQRSSNKSKNKIQQKSVEKLENKIIPSLNPMFGSGMSPIDVTTISIGDTVSVSGIYNGSTFIADHFTNMTNLKNIKDKNSQLLIVNDTSTIDNKAHGTSTIKYNSLIKNKLINK
jgi:hypothetical protein